MKAVEQLSSDLSLHLDVDENISNNKSLVGILTTYLGKEKFEICHWRDRCFYYKYTTEKKTIVFVLAQITYLGHPHPIFKKRIQLKPWYKEVMEKYSNTEIYDFKLMGIYCYKGNVIFVDFDIVDAQNRKWNNSSAHVYTNDLYQAMKNGIFQKLDVNNNIITAIKGVNLKKFFEGEKILNQLFNAFANFNNALPFGQWINAYDVIKLLHDEGSKQWNQSEWPGWYLEHEFEKFTLQEQITHLMKYVSNKQKNELDFDIYFSEDNFYGDLKASDQSKLEAPANDQSNFIECISKYDRFWYVLYEHFTVKDSEADGFMMSRKRNQYRLDNGGWPSGKEFDPLSYSTKLKCKVKFCRMSIIELNRINFREILSDFNQGHQPSGEARAPKFKIGKKNIDNFVVFRYTFPDVSLMSK